MIGVCHSREVSNYCTPNTGKSADGIDLTNRAKDKTCKAISIDVESTLEANQGGSHLEPNTGEEEPRGPRI